MRRSQTPAIFDLLHQSADVRERLLRQSVLGALQRAFARGLFQNCGLLLKARARAGRYKSGWRKNLARQKGDQSPAKRGGFDYNLTDERNDKDTTAEHAGRLDNQPRECLRELPTQNRRLRLEDREGGKASVFHPVEEDGQETCEHDGEKDQDALDASHLVMINAEVRWLKTPTSVFLFHRDQQQR